jgi:ribosomal protein L32
MNTDRTSKRCGYCKGAKKIKKSRYDISAIGCPICKAIGTINIPHVITATAQVEHLQVSPMP